MRARGEAKSSARIALQREGVGKKELKPLRLDRLWHVAVGHIVNRQAVGDVPGRGNGHLDGAKGCLVVYDDRES